MTGEGRRRFSYRLTHAGVRLRRGVSFTDGIGHLHDVVKASGYIILPDMKNGELTCVRAGDWLKTLNAFEFPSKRAIVLAEVSAPYDFDSAHLA
jgi:hypothetical protein